MRPDQELNTKHLMSPQVGDYWQEMLNAILLVLKVNKKEKLVTIVRDKSKLKENYWTWNLEKCEVLTFEEFKEYLTYNTNRENTWADVVPKADRHEIFVKEFRKIARRKKPKSIVEAA